MYFPRQLISRIVLQFKFELGIWQIYFCLRHLFYLVEFFIQIRPHKKYFF